LKNFGEKAIFRTLLKYFTLLSCVIFLSPAFTRIALIKMVVMIRYCLRKRWEKRWEEKSIKNS